MKTLADARTRLVYEGWSKKPVQAEQEGAVIFNAPRPLMGKETWTGDFNSGIFYALVDTKDDFVLNDVELWKVQVDRNVCLDAAVLTWFNDEDLERFTKEYIEWLANEYNRTVEQLEELCDKNEMIVKYIEYGGKVGD